VLDIPGGAGKVPIGPSYVAPSQANGGASDYRVDDLQGRPHRYPLGEP
jgi:lysine 2,3-aminomutase